MKSIEEKSKRYDEALQRTRRWYDSNTNEGYRAIFEDIFPELKESEDERIRKELIEYIRKTIYVNFIGKCSKKEAEKFISWIEKQGEQKSIDDLTQQEAMDIAVAKCFEQSEQKPAWSEEDYNKIESIACHLDNTDNEVTAKVLRNIRDKYCHIIPQNRRKPSDEHYELEEFAKIVRGNLTGISKTVQKLFEAKYLQLTGNKMYGGYKD